MAGRGIRLHRDRRGLGRLRAGQPAVGRPAPTGSCCSRPAGRDRNLWIHLPIGYYRTIFDPRLGWGYETEPEPGLNGRRIPWPRGKVLGGSSSINGLVYIRGQKEDFDHWRQLGNAGWSLRRRPALLQARRGPGARAPTPSTAPAARSRSATPPATSCARPTSAPASSSASRATTTSTAPSRRVPATSS